MPWTNNYNLPEPIVRAVQRDTYNPGISDVTVTRLILPPRIAILQERFRAKIVEDVADGFFRMLGKCVHKLLEEKDSEAVVEKRLYSSERLQGLIVSGQIDRYDPKTRTIQDYKLTTVYSAMNGAKAEWVGQLNLLALLARENGWPVDNLEVILLLRDHSKTQGERQPNYPPSPVIRMPVELFSEERAEWFLNSRLQAYLSARMKLPPCSLEERWVRSNVFAVLKPGGKRAVRLFEDEAEAVKFTKGAGESLIVQKRGGAAVRCESYCPVNQFCDQWNGRQEQD
ncbi:MAG: hypothetical protein GX442_00415 [Candidatus Riflebacteria bacterium]|nr:hypothetical protein [Candidatus Riflebacteria bacterium]